MNRLLQGDVGSGKTAVAEALLYFIVKNGYQGALMVPTEVLAEQHYSEISMLFEGFGIKTVLLTGSMKKSERSKALSDIETGKVQVIIGTHALISEDVKFYNLGLVIADEQHRFGVAQRAMLQSKGNNPHVLVMSATPIPRTLALMLYGDLDISVLDELPPNRQKVDTFFVNGGMEKRVHAFIEKNVDEGGQVYIVCPMIEESEENEDMYSAEAYAERISKLFPQYRIGLIHGKLKTAQKETIMREFAAGNIDVLVATTVIEVGMNVPNASLMVVWNAERFGLSQLHQLRGRVGRGQRKSYCILVSDTRSKMTHDRLTVMTKTNDGFKISEEDLKLRGPGDFFGIRQHGLPEMRIANMSADMIILKQAQEAALNMLREDPSLRLSKNAGIKKALEHMFKRATTNGSFN